MGPPPSDTFFTASPHWGWIIVFYFFFGGLAGGSYFLAALLDIFGSPTDRRLARLGYFAALPCLAVCPPLLIVDLNRPERFWHMMFMSERFPTPMFKGWSPMSYGSWALLGLSAFAAVAFFAALSEGSGRLASRLRFLRPLRERAAPRIGLAVVGGTLAVVIAGYTGILLSVTNRPVWADTPLLGGLFTVSSAASSAALLLLLARRAGIVEASSLAWLSRVEVRFALLELIALVALVISLGPVAKVWLNAWGALLVVGVGLIGIAIPVALHLLHRREQISRVGGSSSPVIAAAMVLVGAFVLRAVIVLSSEAI
jgi:formate-dependent nitrite reductase membrane component NrfD